MKRLSSVFQQSLNMKTVWLLNLFLWRPTLHKQWLIQETCSYANEMFLHFNLLSYWWTLTMCTDLKWFKFCCLLVHCDAWSWKWFQCLVSGTFEHSVLVFVWVIKLKCFIFSSETINNVYVCFLLRNKNDRRKAWACVHILALVYFCVNC